MQQFTHHRRQRLEGLLAELTPLHARLRAQHPGFELAGEGWLGEVAAAFEALGLQGRAAAVARLRTEFDLATRGIDAQRGTRVDTFRRQFRAAAWSRVLAQAEAELQEAIAPEAARLAEAEGQLGKLLLSGLQAGVVTEADLRRARAEDAAEALWYKLAAEPRFGLACRQLLLGLIVADLAILLAALARRISPLTPEPPGRQNPPRGPGQRGATATNPSITPQLEPA